MKHYYFLLVLSMLWMGAFVSNSGTKASAAGSTPGLPTAPDDVIIPIDVDNNPHNKWYVGNNTDKYTIDFADINTAMASSDVKESDTLLICMKAGYKMSDSQYVTKKVVIMGTGYSIAYPDMFVNHLDVRTEGAEVMRACVNNLLLNNNNIKVSNCYINTLYGNETSNDNDYCTIHSCYIKGDIQGRQSYGASEWTFTNNIIRGCVSSLEDATFDHNTFVKNGSDYVLYFVMNSTLTNNILYPQISKGVEDCDFSKNIYSSTGDDVEIGTDNKLCSLLSDFIACTKNDTVEAYYYPVGESMEYSTDGTDCGAFGGEDPYLPGGVKQEVVYVDKTPLENRLTAIDTKISDLTTRIEALSAKVAAFKASYTNSQRLSDAEKKQFAEYYAKAYSAVTFCFTSLTEISNARNAIVIPDKITQTEFDAYVTQISDIESKLNSLDGDLKDLEDQAVTYQKLLDKYFANMPRKTWYVGDNAAQYTINYADINTAMASSDVFEGDTLFICMKNGSQMENQNLTKKTVVIGSGYDTSLATQPIRNLAVRVDGAKVMKLGFESLYLCANNITVENCLTTNLRGDVGTNDNNNCTIHGCFIKGEIYGRETGKVSGWTLTNNVITSANVVYMDKATFNHNTIIANYSAVLLGITNSTLTNNILYNVSAGTSLMTECSGMTFNHNIVFEKADGVDFTTNTYCNTLSKMIYAKVETTDEMYYYPVGISLGYSTDGTDCGAFGGTDPYLLGGTKKADPLPADEIEPNDLLALQNIYDRYNGANWTQYKWNVAGKTPDDYPGVTFETINDSIRVQEISIPKNNLVGDVTKWTVYLPYLTYLNVNGNQLYGDITQFVSKLGRLKTLYIANNMLSGLTSLPASVTSLDKSGQNISYLTTDLFKQIYGDGPSIYICDQDNWPSYAASYQNMIGKYSIVAYDLKTNSLTYPTIYTYNNNGGQPDVFLNTQDPVYTSSGYTYYTNWNNSLYNYSQDKTVFVVSTEKSYFPAKLKFITGDANMDGRTSILDVQTTINYILVPSTISLYNWTAANTYQDNLMNVQDVVCTVNLLLTPAVAATPAPVYSKPALAKVATRVENEDVPEDGIIYTSGNSVRLSTEKVASALDIELNGVSTNEVGLMLNRKDFQISSKDTENGSHYVIYSISGKTIPAGDTEILRLSNSKASIKSVACSTPEATAIHLAISDNPTAVSTVNADTDTDNRVGKYIENGKLVIKTSNGTYSAAGNRIK